MKLPANITACLMALFYLSVTGATVQAQIVKDSALAALVLKAKNAADAHKFELADSLYMQALRKSQELKLSAETVHITSQLVRSRAINHKIVIKDPQVESALELVKQSIKQGSYDPNCSVWLSDIADTYYWAGATALNPVTQESDIRKYIEISSLIQGGFDPKLFERSFELVSLLDREGRYQDSMRALENLKTYMQRVKPPPLAMSNLSYSLGTHSLALKHTSGSSFALCLNIQSRTRIKSPHDYTIQRTMALELLQQGKTQDAKKVCDSVLETHAKFTAPKTDATAADYLLLGMIAEQKGDKNLAAQNYKTALEYFTFAAEPKNRMFDLGTCSLAGGKAVAAQALSDVLRKQGKVKESLNASREAKKLWSQNKDWTPVQKMDEVTFFLLFGHLPSTKATHA